MPTLITKEVKIGKGNSTVTMGDIPSNPAAVPGGKGAASYERMSNQYPNSPLFSSQKFQNTKAYADYYYSVVFGRGEDGDGLSVFEDVEGAGQFPNSGISGNISKSTVASIPDVPQGGTHFDKSSVVSVVNQDISSEPTDSMPLTPYYPNTASPSTTLATGLADQQGISSGPIAPDEVEVRPIRQFGVGNGSRELPHVSTVEIASRMTVSDA